VTQRHCHGVIVTAARSDRFERKRLSSAAFCVVLTTDTFNQNRKGVIGRDLHFSKLPASFRIENIEKRKERFMALKNAPDLTQRPPRSPRVRLGGYAILPRMLDKGRATIAGKHGEYNYACPLDERFLEFAGISADALKKQLEEGNGDGEILEWVQKNAKHKRTEAEIEAWSEVAEQRVPGDPESRDYFNELHKKAAPKREDVRTWFDLLDVDDYVSFGGKA
jgi:hypothetical protein